MTSEQQRLALYRAKGDLSSVGINPQLLYDPFYLSPQEHSEAIVAIENGIIPEKEFKGYEEEAMNAKTPEKADVIWAGYRARKKALEELQAFKAKPADGSKEEPPKRDASKPIKFSNGSHLRYSVF